MISQNDFCFLNTWRTQNSSRRQQQCHTFNKSGIPDIRTEMLKMRHIPYLNIEGADVYVYQKGSTYWWCWLICLQTSGCAWLWCSKGLLGIIDRCRGVDRWDRESSV